MSNPTHRFKDATGRTRRLARYVRSRILRASKTMLVLRHCQGSQISVKEWRVAQFKAAGVFREARA